MLPLPPDVFPQHVVAICLLVLNHLVTVFITSMCPSPFLFLYSVEEAIDKQLEYVSKMRSRSSNNI